MMAEIVEFLAEFIAKSVKVEEICKGCLREAKSQCSHENDRCLIVLVQNFVQKNMEEILEQLEKKLNDVPSRDYLQEIVCQPATFVAVAQLIAS